MKTRKGYIVKKFHYGIGWRILDETGAVDTRPNGVVELSEPEVLIWNMLSSENGSEEAELIEAVKTQFGLDEEKASCIVKKFYDYLCQHRFIEGVEPRMFG